MRVEAAQNEAAAMEECQQRERSLTGRSIDAQPQFAAGAFDAAFRDRAHVRRGRHEPDASLVLDACLDNRQRVGRRHAGSHVEQRLDLWIDGHSLAILG
jgi:hypothetical protein